MPISEHIPLKVMSFNIAHGHGIDSRVDLERTIEAIKESCADLIGIQEVDRHFGGRSRFEDQAQVLADRLGLYYAYGANLDLEPEQPGGKRRQYGNLTLSRYPITESRNHKLPQVISPSSWNEPRGLLECGIDVNGTPIRFFNTHLGLNAAEQIRQVDYIRERADASREPVIIVGDFNAAPDRIEIRRMVERYQDVLAERGLSDACTFIAPSKESSQSYTPVERIDYIFSTGHLEIHAVQVIDKAVSDHLAITATLLVRGDAL